MPKEMTHWVLAERSLAALSSDSSLRAIIRDHHETYLGGAVLPDTLLHLIRGPYTKTALELAHRFHDSAGCSYTPLIAAERRYPDGLPPDLMACLLGVIAHMQADIVFHPFVYAQSGTDDIGRHYQVETGIDCHFMCQETAPVVKRLSELLSPAVHDALITVCSLLFDPEGLLPHTAIDQALKLHCRFQAMYDRTHWKLAVRLAAHLAGPPFDRQRHLFYPLTGRRGTGSSGNDAVEWRHPVSGRSRRTSIEELAEEAVQRIKAAFERIETAGSLSLALTGSPGENLLTGMHGACLPKTAATTAD
jgi:Zinc dependent phospholipase C